MRNRKSDDDIAHEFSILIPLENSFRRGRTGADNLFKLPIVEGLQADGDEERHVFILDGGREHADGASNFRSSARGLCSNITGVLQEFATRKVDDSAHRTVNLFARPPTPHESVRERARFSCGFFIRVKGSRALARFIRIPTASLQRKREESLPRLAFPQRISYF